MRRSLFAPISAPTLSLFALAAASAFAAPLSTALSVDERRSLQRETLSVIEFLQGYHYSHRPLNELNAQELLEGYFHQLDPERRFFLHGDTEFLRRRFERNLKAVYLFKGDLHPAFEIYDVFAKRVAERCAWISTRLGNSFAFEADTLFTTDRSEEPRPASNLEAGALWEKILQNELIQLREHGHDAEAAVAELRRHYAEFRQRVTAADPLRVRERFLNELMELFDPHSGYFSKETADVISGDLTGAITGIGVDLRSSEGRFLVKSLQPGGPAELQGELQPGDEFLSVATPDTPATPLAGRRLREVVELIRGKPGTRLSIHVRPADGGTQRTIELERSRLEIAENHASGLLYQVPIDGRTHTIGVVSLPAFYGDTEEGETTASMTKDVAELLAKFSTRGAEAVIVDVRDNGGGLINEAVSLIGLFIEKGPALLTRGKSGAPAILRDENPEVAFAGPLVVITSRHSASASEGFAGAMQAYRRALIVGDEATFGKGTMQSVVELGKASTALPESVRARWGMARVTRAFFYGPDGSSPQFDGVRSDVALPVSVAPGDVRENELPHALPSTRIPTPEPLDTTSTAVARLTPELLTGLQSAAAQRVASLPEFALETQAHALRQEFWKTGPVSLSLTKRLRVAEDLMQRRLELRRARRALDAEIAYTVERIDLEVVEKNRRNHQAALLARRTAGGEPLANRLDRDTFYYAKNATAELRRIPVDAFDWDVALAAAPELTAVWCEATGRTHDETVLTAVRNTLATLKLRDADAPAPIPVATIFRQQLGGDIDEPTLQRAIGAFFKAAAERDVDVLLDQRPLDIHLRESLRLASDWAHRENETKKLAAAAP
jgi:carboxyl-terminal processing protease